MKNILKVGVLTLMFGLLSSFQSIQNQSLEQWLDLIVKDMIEMNDLRKYSHQKIPSDVTINFFMVEAVKDVRIDQNVISMLINHGNGKYCTEIKFKYIQIDDKFYLVFSEPTTESIFGEEKKIVNPWLESKKVCQ